MLFIEVSTHLVRMLDVDAEAELLEDPPLSLDDLVLQGDVLAIEDHRSDGPKNRSIHWICSENPEYQ